MFTRGIFNPDRTGKAGFAVETRIDVIPNIMVEITDGNLLFTSGDWQSYYDLYQKLCQVTLSMKNVLKEEGTPRHKYSHLT